MADMREVGTALNALFDPAGNPLVATLGTGLTQAIERMAAASAITEGSGSQSVPRDRDYRLGTVPGPGDAFHRECCINDAGVTHFG